MRPDVRSKIFTPPHAPHVGQSTARSWSTEIGCGDWHTIAVRRDGTALATGNNQRGQTDVARWTHVSGVFAGYLHTVGLHEDGTVVAVSDDSRGQC
ncbi:RCC1 domain-containing protein, partial [uncultured Corynebacterium sp.]|uniref:RCC1 domain-containing protein n=2 Tax=uncultured Corynebacterium sp. TaxID=159447 RepID=UPI0025996118